jgi:hypothetical protein
MLDRAFAVILCCGCSLGFISLALNNQDDVTLWVLAIYFGLMGLFRLVK